MGIQQVRKDIQLQVIKQQLKDLSKLRNELDNRVLFNDSLALGFLVQTSHGVWEFETQINNTNLIKEPVSFPYIYPHIYKVETGNTIPKKTEYSVEDVTVNYADQLTAYAGKCIYKD